MDCMYVLTGTVAYCLNIVCILIEPDCDKDMGCKGYAYECVMHMHAYMVHDT